MHVGYWATNRHHMLIVSSFGFDPEQTKQSDAASTRSTFQSAGIEIADRTLCSGP
jgi:hypothetical protein